MRVYPCVLAMAFFSPVLSTKTAVTAAEVSRAECVMEVNSRRVLYESHGDLRLPMASTTKIVTACTVLERENLQDKVIIPAEAAGIEGSSVYLKAGEEYTVEDLLYGLMLRSGNDCAVALALYSSGSVGEFSARMNETAQKAGALNSNFKNPHGLPCKGHYTTARDLTGITCYAMQNPTFRTIVSTRYYAAKGWKNKNKMLYRFEGACGVKTGYTKEAGRCLVSAVERGGMTLVCTVLGCSPTYERSSNLFNDCFAAYSYRELLTEEEVFAVGEGKNAVKGYVRHNYSYPILEGEEAHLEYKAIPLDAGAKWKNKEEIVGHLEIYLAKRLLFSTNLYKL